MLAAIVRTVFLKMRHWSEAVRYPGFYQIRIEAGGMMKTAAYKKISELVARLPDLDIVEIGGGAGAGSIVIAQAMKKTGKKSRVIVVEKCEGGSRARFGDYQANLATINNNFEKFGVQKMITLFPEKLTYENGAKILALIKTKNLAALVSDADGRIDRDFFLFWPGLMAGGAMIFDDYQDRSQGLINSENYFRALKKTMTYRLLNQMMAWGLFKISGRIGKTVFGYKPEEADFNKFDRSVCQKIIKNVQFEITQGLNSRQK